MDSNILRNKTIFWSRMGIGIGFKALDDEKKEIG